MKLQSDNEREEWGINNMIVTEHRTYKKSVLIQLTSNKNLNWV